MKFNTNLNLGFNPIIKEKRDIRDKSFYRYKVSFHKSNGDLSEWYSTEIERPRVEINRVAGLDYRYNNRPINITLIDSVGLSDTQDILEWFNESDKREMKIEKLDPTGVVVELISLSGVLIIEINLEVPSENDFICCSFRYDSVMYQ